MRKKGGRERSNRDKPQRTLVYAIGNESVYAHVLKPLGQGRFEVNCSDMVKRICKIAGKLHKREFIKENDYVLVSLRPGDDKKGDIICKYYSTEVKILKDSKELPDTFGEFGKEQYHFGFED